MLFLIDEILQGTNSHNRLVEAEAVVRELFDDGAVGMVTTHDLELMRIVEGLERRAAHVHSHAGDDIIRGYDGNDRLYGGAGNDRMQGNDHLDGGKRSFDRIWGGSSRGTFVRHKSLFGRDAVDAFLDFWSGYDSVDNHWHR